MARYNLNQVLKDREAKEQKIETTEIKLDDVSRVKVLSPGRQVAKRFIRNRLAVFGGVLLLIMFLFSFVGPLFYAYGQKDIFYTYEVQNTNYALAKENGTYNGYVVDDSVEVETLVATKINTRIKTMQQEGEPSLLIPGSKGMYIVNCLGDEVYTMGTAETEIICKNGDFSLVIGKYDAVEKKLSWSDGVDEISGVERKCSACRGASGSFEVDGVEYTFVKTNDKGKIYEIMTGFSGVGYENGVASLGSSFDAMVEEYSVRATDIRSRLDQKADIGIPFEFEGDTYYAVATNGFATIYKELSQKVSKVYTRYTLDTFVTGSAVSDDFRANALMAVYDTGAFTAGGNDYTVSADESSFKVLTAYGSEFAEFTPFSVRRYTGEDSMDYGLKKAISDYCEDLVSKGLKDGELTYEMPVQNEKGQFVFDENGKPQVAENTMRISQRDTGEFVVNCEQITYVIDMYASPSAKHVLGTDGDGFDVLARVMYGGRVSLLVGFVVVFLETFLGIIMGGLAGYFGGWVDNLIMRLVDIFYCIPSMPIMIILGAIMDAARLDARYRLLIMMAALGIMGWAGVARLVRGQILSLREQEFMVATEATGIKIKDRIFRHLVPNVMPQLIVTATMGLGGVILTESTLSFLGLGVKHPMATWGTIINSVSTAVAMKNYTFIWVPVGLLICLTVIAFNFVGDGLRDAYDPKAKR